MRHAISAPIVIVVLTAALLAGCGGDDSESAPATETSTSTSTTTGNGGGNGGGGKVSAACGTYTLVQATGQAVDKLDPSDASAAQVKKAVTNLSKSVEAFAGAASKAAGATKSDVKSAVDTFQSEFDSAEGQPPAQQLNTLGNAIDELQGSLKQTVDQLGC